VKPLAPEEKEALKKVETSLEDSMKQLLEQIKIADRSDHAVFVTEGTQTDIGSHEVVIT